MKITKVNENQGNRMRRKKGYFSISAVAEMFSIHPQTIRLYEQEGFITPKRTDGNTRLFSEEDVNKLEEIVYLTHNLGINLAGVEMILKLKKQIKKLQKEMNAVFHAANSELEREEALSKEAIKVHATRLVHIQRKNMPNKAALEDSASKNQLSGNDVHDWKIEYDE